MPWLPSIVPKLDDREIYLVLDDFGGRLGRAWPEADEARTDRNTVIAGLLEGQYSDPVRVVAFNTAEGWSRDVSEEIAIALLEQMAEEGPLNHHALEDSLTVLFDRSFHPAAEAEPPRQHVAALSPREYPRNYAQRLHT